jgi:5'-deoxynucleotidase YfbR-like HD superfamily hydrolase
MERLANRESVLEHLGQVVLTSLMLASEIRNRDLDAEIDLFVVMARAAVHDVEEVITGDVARPTKYSSRQTQEMFYKLSVSAIEDVASELSMRADLPGFASVMRSNHRNAKGPGLEGCVVALADILAVVTKVWEEVILRNSGAMIRQAHTARKQLVAYQKRINDEIDRDSPTHEFLSRVVVEALLVTDEAICRDSQWLGTKVETY